MEASQDATENEPAVTATIRAGTLKTTLNSVSVLVDECKIHFDEEGLAIRSVDPANVGMVTLLLEPEAFESYNPSGDVLGVDLTRLLDILGMAEGSDELVNITYDQHTKKLLVQMNGLEYNLALIDTDSIREEPDIPDLDLPATIVMKGRDLNRGIKAANMVSDHITLQVNENTEQFIMSARGDTDEIELDLEEDDLIDFIVGSADSMYSLDYLSDMNKAIPRDAEVTMELGDSFPAKMHFPFANGAGHTTYILAPRIQSD